MDPSLKVSGATTKLHERVCLHNHDTNVCDDYIGVDSFTHLMLPSRRNVSIML